VPAKSCKDGRRATSPRYFDACFADWFVPEYIVCRSLGLGWG
jgi:hypothetical protein